MAKNLGDAFSREMASRTPQYVATVTALKAIAAEDRFDSQLAFVTAAPAAGGGFWKFMLSSSLTGDDQLVAAPSAGSGRWLKMPGQTVDLSLAFTFNTADAAVLYTMPTGSLALVRRGYWEIAADMTGGSSSAIGLSGPSPHNTKGDILGGAGGDVAATLTAALAPQIGTVGADQAAGIRLKAADTIKFDRIVSAFTAGSGNAHVVLDLLKNDGA